MPAPGLGYALPARNYDILTSVRRPFVFFYGFSILHESFLIRHILPHRFHAKFLYIHKFYTIQAIHTRSKMNQNASLFFCHFPLVQDNGQFFQNRQCLIMQITQRVAGAIT